MVFNELKRIKFLSIVFLSLFLLAGCSSDDDHEESYDVSGRIVYSNEAGNQVGLEGVNLNFKYTDGIATTNHDGNWSKNGVKDTDVITPAKGNWRFIPGSRRVSKESSSLDFTARTEGEYKIAVLSDLHYFDPRLGTEGAAFENYLAHDRKLIAESKAILESAIQSLKEQKPDVVLIPGDLTKDGERVNHEQLANYFAELEKEGIQVYVAPGNHDINNPHAVRYEGDEAIEIETITADEFASIYQENGYSESEYIEKDKKSLSYLVEPISGVWLVAMDTCRYDDNGEDPVTAGRFRASTLEWVRDKIKEGKSQGKTVIGMMHHGLIEHFELQSAKGLFEEYVVEDWEAISTELADLGMEVVFTGHYHANDIAIKTTDEGNRLYDIETGSLVTYPSPYRMLTLTDNNLEVETYKVTEVDADTGGLEFQDYAKGYIEEGLLGLTEAMLATDGFLQNQIEVLAPVVSSSLIAHYEGDENFDSLDDTTQYIISNMKLSEDPMGVALWSIWHDESADNNTEIYFEFQ
ncbi:Calcineurin-like phosphoesterase [Orenia metallireducens]|uniref:Calcineurin-like phosphoesterase n=1 Tax=Orenia metallireducens TaxID=1413210 RepID=A0A285GZ77_9FIRM|nr:metallophosphoesterase [Orenia metallireducens]SNY27836.1 Calcineurin-like phosphoesterase [Orenia metallireducens]